MFSKHFAKATLERAIKTFAQAAVALLVGDQAGIVGIDWTSVASVAGLAAIVSVLTSIASAGVGDNESPSLVDEH